MDKKFINNMTKGLEHIRSLEEGYPHREGETTPATQALLTQLQRQIQEMESTLMDLRGDDSAATKIFRWFREHFLTREEYQNLRVKANENTFKLFIPLEETLNLNLKREVGSWRAENPADEEFYNNFRNTFGAVQRETPWVEPEEFAPFASMEGFFIDYNKNLILEFKYSKKLFRDPDVMERALGELVAKIYRKCLEQRRG